MEQLEHRRVLAQVTLTAVADGEIADRDLDGLFDEVDSADALLTDRWFDFSGAEQEERIAFEFSLASVPAGATINSVSLGFEVGLRTSPPDPGLLFYAYSGDGAITLADADSPSSLAGGGSIDSNAVFQFDLDPAAVVAHWGSHLGIRAQNSVVNGSWLGIESLEGFGSKPTLTIDYDPQVLTVAVQSDSISEGDGTGASSLIVSRNGDLSQPLSISLFSSDDGEAVTATSTTIPALADSVAVPIDAVDDFLVDGTQTVTFTATAPSYLSGEDSVDVIDNDVAGVTVSPSSGLLTSESGDADEFTIVLTSEPIADVTIPLSSSDPSEGIVSPVSVTFTPGDWNVPQVVTVTGVDDETADGDQDFQITAGAVSSTDVHYGSTTDPIIVDNVSVTNRDNDGPMLTVSVLADAIFENQGIEATVVTIARNTSVDQSLTVSLSSSDTTEAIVPPTVTIPAGQHQTTVFLDAVDDAEVDGAQSVTISAAHVDFSSVSDQLIVNDVESGMLEDRIWFDVNGDGVQDVTEIGVAGAVVELFQSTDSIIGNEDDVSRQVAVSDSLGHYQLSGLVDGLPYYLQFRVPSGHLFTKQHAAGDDSLDSDVDAVGVTEIFLFSESASPRLAAGVVQGPGTMGFVGRAGGPLVDGANALATDAAGNLYVSGTYHEKVDFDLGPSVYSLRSVNTQDVYVAKYTSQGSLIWARGIDGSAVDTSEDLAVSRSGEVVVTGAFQGTADFDPGIDVFELTSAGGNDVFVWKLDAEGNFLAARAIGSTRHEYPGAVAFSPNGEIAVVGSFLGTVDFDPGPEVHSLVNTSTSRRDVFVVTLDHNADFLWAQRLGGTGNDSGYDVAHDLAGNAYVTGNFSNVIDFDPGPETDSHSSRGSFDAFLWKLSGSGEYEWGRTWGGTSSDFGNRVVVSPSGNAIVAGTFKNTVDFDPGESIEERTADGSQDNFLIQLTPVGDLDWVRPWGGPGVAVVSDLKLAIQGDVYLAGNFSLTVDFDPSDASLLRTSAGSSDAFFAVMDATGNLKWAHTLGGAEQDQASGIAPAPDGSAFVAGYYTELADFDPFSGVSELRSNSEGQDLFVAKFPQPAAPTSIELLNDRVIEGQPVGTPVGAFASSDNDDGDSFTYRLAQGVGDDDNSSFRIENNALWTAAVFDHAAKSRYSVRVRSTDASGRSFEQSLTVSVLPVAAGGAIGDRIWHDANGDGIQDDGEAGASGIAVEVYSADDNLLRSRAVSGEDGTYLASGLAPGLDYYAVFRVPAHHSFSQADAGTDDLLDSDANELGVTDPVHVSAGETVDSVDAGLIGNAPDYGFPTNLANNGSDQAQAVATDSHGNIYLAGSFQNTVDFDPGPNVVERSAVGSGDVFVAKYSSAGSLIWAKRFGGTSSEEATDLIVDEHGNVTVAGWFQATVDFDPGDGEHLLSSRGSTDAFVAKLDANGDLLWAHRAGSTSSDYAYGLAQSSDGSVYVSGYFRYTADFDPSEATYELSASGLDAYLWKLDGAGEFVWAKRFGGTGTDTGLSVAVTPSDNVVLAGAFQGSADMDPGPGTSTLVSAGSSDAFVTALDSHGDLLWTRGMGSTGVDQVNVVKASPSGDLFIAGKFAGSINFNFPVGSTTMVSAGNNDAFVAKLDSAGDFHWASRWGGVNSEDVQGLAIGADGSIYTTSTFAGPSEFPVGDQVVERHAAGSFDIAVNRLDPSGVMRWIQSFGGAGYDTAYDLIETNDGNLVAAGFVTGSADFDPGSDVFLYPGRGNRDIFANQMSPPEPPAAVALTENRVLETATIGTAIGRLLGSGSSENESFVFELVVGAGDDDNSAFTIDGTLLRSNQTFAADLKASLQIRVRATGHSGLWFEQPLTISVLPESAIGSIGDRVWLDQNGDGIQTVGEPGFADVAVEAVAIADGLSRAWAVTDQDGNFLIDGLLPDVAYELRYRIPPDHEFTTPFVGGDSGADSDVDEQGVSPPITLAAGESRSDVDAGVIGEPPWFGFAFRIGADVDESLVDRVTAAVTDENGNVYVSGHYSGTVDFDPGLGEYELTSQSASNGYVAKYSSMGTLLWTTNIGGPGAIYARSLSLAANGDVIVGGAFTQTATWFDSISPVTFTSEGGTDSLITRLDPASGNLVWAKHVSGVGNVQITEVATHTDGMIAATGYFSGSADFNPASGTTEMTSAGVDDIFVLKLDDDGVYQWARRMGGSSYDRGHSVAFAPDGSIDTTGYFRYNVDFDPGAGTQMLTALGSGYDAFVMRLDASGNYVRAWQYGGTGNDYGYSIAVGTDDSVYASGRFESVADFDPGAGSHELTSVGGTDAFLVKMNAAAELEWVWQLGSTVEEHADVVVLGPTGQVYVAGRSNGGFTFDADFDPGPDQFFLPGVDIGSHFVTELNTSGEFQWARQVPASGSPKEFGLAVDPDGDVFVASSYVGNADFSPGSSVYSIPAQSQLDAFVWKFTPPVAPSSIALQENRVLEQQPPGTVVGRLTAEDADVEDAFTFELVEGIGDDDNADFQIVNGLLITTRSFDAQVRTDYRIRVRAVDSAGRSYQQPLDVMVLDLSAAASLGDRVWHDWNENGVQDVGEPGVAGIVAELFATEDGLSRGIAVTDASGNYSFTGLQPGQSYFLRFRVPAGYAFTVPHAGEDDHIDSDVGADGTTASISLSSGENASHWDAGLVGAAPSFGFAYHFGAENVDRASEVAMDEDGNSYITGTFLGTVDFDPGPGTKMLSTDHNAQNVIVAKYTPAGALVWAAQMESNDGYGEAIDVGDDGNIYVTGRFGHGLTYRIGTTTLRLDGQGFRDIFVAKIQSDGQPVWLKGFVGGTGSGNAITSAPDGSVYSFGYFDDTVDFDPGPGTFTLTHTGSYDSGYVSKLDANGDFLWAKHIAGSDVDPTAIELADDGSIYLGGFLSGGADFDPGPDTFRLASRLSYRDNGFVAKWDPNGDFLWARATSGTSAHTVRGLAVAADQSVIATGGFQGIADFDPGDGEFSLTSVSSADDIFLWKLDANGEFVWAKQLEGVGYDYGQAIETTSDGNVIVGGIYGGFIDLDPGPGTFEYQSTGGYDSFIAKYDPSANLIWAQSFAANAIYDIAVAADDSVYSAGALGELNSDMDPRSGVYSLDATSSDIFLSVHRPPSAPTAVVLPANRVFEQQPIGTVIGGLVGTDPDVGESFRFAFVPGVGDDDNATFSISDGKLITAAVFDAAVKDTYSIRVEATDAAGLKVQTPISVRIVPLANAGSISGQVFNDIDGDGVRGANEPPVMGTVAELRTAGDQMARDVVVVDEEGRYTFHDVVPDVEHVVVFRSPIGLVPTLSNIGSDEAVDSDADTHGVSDSIWLDLGQPLRDIDVGLVGTPPSFGFAIGIGSPAEDEGKAVITDADGNVYVAGTFDGLVDMDPGPQTWWLDNQDTSEDVFLAKYSSMGALVWAKHIRGDAFLEVAELTLHDGTLTLVGNNNGIVDVDPGAADVPIDSDNYGSFLVQLDTNGDYLWSTGLPGSVQDVAIGPDDSLLVTGIFGGATDFDVGPGTYELTSVNGSDGFVMKLSAAGELEWANPFGGTGTDEGERIAVDASGNVYVVGVYSSTADFEPGPYSTSLTSSGTFVMRVLADGTFDWVGRVGYQYGRALAVTDEGDVFGSGLTAGSGDFDPGLDVYYAESYGFYDIPIYRLDSDGNLQWASFLGGTEWDRSYNIALAANGDVVGSGGFEDVADFDPGPIQNLLTSAGESDAVIFRVTDDGNAVSAFRFGGPGEDIGNSVAVGGDGSIYSTGFYSDRPTLDSNVGEINLAHHGDQDAFLWKLTANRAPEQITLDHSQVLELSPAGTSVGDLATVDENVEDRFTYTLVAGHGDQDNSAFQIDGTTLKTVTEVDQLTPFLIRVRSTDREGQWTESTFEISVDPVTPVIQFLRQTPLTAVTNVDELVFHAAFNMPVDQVDATDFLIVGGSTAGITDVAVVAGTGETTFAITVQGGDLDSFDGAVGLDLAANQDIVSTLGVALPTVEPTVDEVFLLDNTAPQVSSIRYGAGNPSVVDSITVAFDSEVVFDANAVIVTDASGQTIETEVAQPTSNTIEITFVGLGHSLPDGEYVLRVVGDLVADIAGNRLDGDSSGVPGVDAVDDFYRLFGDSDGDQDVDGNDLKQFGESFAKRQGDVGFDSAFDSDGDGDVDGLDALELRRRLFQRI